MHCIIFPWNDVGDYVTSCYEILLPKTYREQLQITETLGAYEKEKTLMENAEKASVLIRELIKKLDIPHKLRDFNVAKDTIPQVVENILLDIEGKRMNLFSIRKIYEMK